MCWTGQSQVPRSLYKVFQIANELRDLLLICSAEIVDVSS